VKKTVEGKAMVGLQTEAAGGHASARVGPLSALVATLHHLVHPLEREKLAAEASAEDERKRVPKRSVSHSPMEAGITGGFSLLANSSYARKRR